MRALRKQPAFSGITILTLALGIGATAAVFSLIQGVLLTPPPYRHPEQLVLVHTARANGQPSGFRAWPAQQWQDWQQQARSFDGVAAYSWLFNYVISNDGSESVEGMIVTKDYFRLTGLRPVLGRTFAESETKTGAPPVVVLGYEFWQRKYRGDRGAIGQTIRISRWDPPPTIIGVMPPGIRFLPSPADAKEPNYNVNALVDLWLPVTPNPDQRKDPRWDVVARLRPGVTPRKAQEEISVLAGREAQQEHEFEGIVPQVEPLGGELNRDGGRILYPLLGAAALVLLIACGNAAALLLVRGLQRQQEYAVRSALGVGRIALFRQVSTESLLLAIAGGALGAGLAFGVVRMFKLIAGHAIPRLDAVTTGWPVLACALAGATFAAVLAGLFPALRASRLDPIEVLKSAGPKSSAGKAERRLLRAVTVLQTSLTLALLVGATLLIRTMMNLSTVPAGYRTDRILTMSVTAVQGKWEDFHRRALERVSALAGVQYAAFAWGVPLTGNNWPVTLEIEGQPPALKESDKIVMPARAVTSDYFKALGLPIVAGRELRTTDSNNSAQVAVVNQAFADRYFPGASAIGKKIWMNGRSKPGSEVVGVVANGRTDDLTQAAMPEIYFSLWQARAFSKHLVVRTAGDPHAVMASVQRELRAVDPTASIEGVKTLEEIRQDSLASRNFAMQLLAGFSVIGSILTLVGIYGVLSLSVAARRREIAIRAAVGAGRQDIRKLIFGEGFRLVGGGVIVGLGVALLLSRMLRSLLFEVKPTDPLTLAGAAVLFAGVAMLACWVPSHRAVRVDPVEALRYE